MRSTALSGLVPSYVCQRQGIEQGQRVCQVVPGANVDQTISKLLLELMTPVTLEVALAVQQELQARLADADRLRRQQVQRARYEADLAQERFLQVDPKNRFVADALEADWNDKLRVLAEAEEQYQKQSQADRAVLDQQTKDKILALATDFPRLWRDPKTSDRDRKRMVRLLIEDVTLSKTDHISAQVRCKGGTTHPLTLPLPVLGCMAWQTDPAIVALIDQWLDHRRARRTRPQLAHQVTHDRVLPGVATRAQLLEDALCRHVGIPFQEFLDYLHERIELGRPFRLGRCRGGTLCLHVDQNAARDHDARDSPALAYASVLHAAARDASLGGNRTNNTSARDFVM
jgi:hypothetical protein